MIILNSNEEYLEYIQEYEKKEMTPGLLDKKFHSLIEERKNKWTHINNIMPNDSLGEEVTSIREEILNLLTDEEKIIVRQIPMGCVQTGDFNAHFSTSMCGKKAIVMYSGLMVFFHKVSKFIIAEEMPDAIIHCNRGRCSPSDISNYLHEMIEYYKINFEPKGALIQLDDRIQRYASTITNLWEFFILSHEVGHALKYEHNKESFNFIKWSKIPIIKILVLKHHTQEFEADLFGAKLTIKYAQNQYNLSQEETLGLLHTLFSILEKLSGSDESFTHPSPKQRIEYINSNI